MNAVPERVNNAGDILINNEYKIRNEKLHNMYSIHSFAFESIQINQITKKSINPLPIYRSTKWWKLLSPTPASIVTAKFYNANVRPDQPFSYWALLVTRATISKIIPSKEREKMRKKAALISNGKISKRKKRQRSWRR